jgi:hypothetical protein
VDEVLVRLDHPDENTRKLVGKWFIGEGSSRVPDPELTGLVIRRLKAQFERVSELLHSRGVIFSDLPVARFRGDTGTAILPTDKFPIIYLPDSATIGEPQSLAGESLSSYIFHEMMHLDRQARSNPGSGWPELYQLLEPSSAFSTARATRNAENLMYFALDLLGELPGEEGHMVLHEPTAR